MKKQRRPKNKEKKVYGPYYKPKDPNHIEVTKKLHRDRLFEGYKQLHLIVFDREIRYTEGLPIKEMIRRFV